MSEKAEYEILYSSYLLKRTKQHNWQKKWFVLRRNQLSYYKDSTEYKASRVLSIDEILSFNEIPDNHKLHFIIVTNSRIYHLKALDQASYDKWIKILDELLNQQQQQQQQRSAPPPLREQEQGQEQVQELPRLEPHFEFTRPTRLDSIDQLQQDFTSLQFSGTDDNFTSDAGSRNQSTAELVQVPAVPNQVPNQVPTPIPEETSSLLSLLPSDGPAEGASPEEPSYYNSFASTSPDHVIAKGHLYRLKRRYNQWKKYYIVLTNHFLFFFKTERDAETNKIHKKINASDVLDAVELDPLSRSRVYCMLIVTPLKRIRFCADTEEELTRWLVLLKTIAKTRRQEREGLVT